MNQQDLATDQEEEGIQGDELVELGRLRAQVGREGKPQDQRGQGLGLQDRDASCDFLSTRCIPGAVERLLLRNLT